MTSPPLSSRRLALMSGFAFLAVVGGVSVCDAQSPWRRRLARPAPPPYRVSLEALDGSILPTFQLGGATYVLGESGDRYNVRVQNPTAERIEVVVTVDGHDAITGDVGDYVAQRGYLIEPWGSLLVEGFRRSLDEVAAFRFAGRGASYSARRGTPEHVGVIGVAVFPEKARPPTPIWQPRRRLQPESEYRAPAPNAPPRAQNEEAFEDDAAPSRRKSTAGRGRSSAGPSNIGTAYGESERSRVVEVSFERRSPTHPSVVLRLRYDDYDGLEARGVDLSSLGYVYRDQPDPFPLSQSRFAPPPR